MVVQAAASGAEALDWLRRGDSFGIAVLDMQMPGMDGVQLAEAIRELRTAEELPLVLLTSLGRRAEDLSSNRFVACLSKPIKASQLYDALISITDLSTARPTSATTRPKIDSGMAARLPLRLLLAKDNIVNQKVALLTLGRLGYRADVAGNGLEVLEALARQDYDVILMDVQMPELDGLETTRRICQDWAPTERPRIIAMTANAMQGDRELCLTAGMDDYISKPIRTEDLIRALERSVPAARLPRETARVSAPEPAPRILDRGVLTRLQADLGGNDTAIVDELIDLFLADTPQLLVEMQKALADGATNVVQRAAHTLKSSSAGLGAHALATHCSALEQLAHDGRLDGANDYLEQIGMSFCQVQQVLREIQAESLSLQT
jgi:CheY-like chemotaxis protein/HPt (histidine-containing phosphotransfer) domain-containing protein